MSKAAGIVLILSGLGLAALAMSSELAIRGSDASRQVADANVARVAAKPVEPVAVPRPQPVLRTAAAPHPEAAPPGIAPVVVTLAPRSGDAAPVRMAVIPRDRDSLARELQKELRRVGCYEGELNGVWTPATRRAMKIFTDRVNATLPVDEPDAVLFAMVQSQQERVCGKPCPVDQGLSEDGRCLPNAILAKAARRPPLTVAQLPKADPAPVARRGTTVAGWSARVAAAAPALPPAVAVAPAARQVPVDDRMGLAGPMAEPKRAAADGPPPVARRHVRSRQAARVKPPRHASAPGRSTFARVVFRRVDSAY
jgi:hypothetical protein